MGRVPVLCTYLNLYNLGLVTTAFPQAPILFAVHYDDVTWTSRGLKSPAIRLLVEHFIQTHIKETSKSELLVLCVGNSPVPREFPTQRASRAEKASISWRSHALPWRHALPNLSLPVPLLALLIKSIVIPFQKHWRGTPLRPPQVNIEIDRRLGEPAT